MFGWPAFPHPSIQATCTWPDLLTLSNEFLGKLLYTADTYLEFQWVQQGEETIEFQAEVEDSAIQSLPAMS